MMHIETIFFDFDGVILESVNIKGWAFKKLFEKYGEHVDKIVAFHYENGGMPRFDKFRYIYSNILKTPLADDEFDSLCCRFSDIVYKRVLECDFVPGALEFLKKHYQSKRFYIITGTPQEEIELIINNRRLGKYFKGVYGSPTAKGFWVKKILSQEKMNSETAIFIGDALSDLNAANENHIRFVGRITDENREIFKNKSFDFKVRDLFEFDAIINKEN